MGIKKSHFLLHISVFRTDDFPTNVSSNFRLLSSNFRLPTSVFRLRTSNLLLHPPYRSFRNGAGYPVFSRPLPTPARQVALCSFFHPPLIRSVLSPLLWRGRGRLFPSFLLPPLSPLRWRGRGRLFSSSFLLPSAWRGRGRLRGFNRFGARLPR